MSMEHWWHNTDRGESKSQDRSPLRCNFVHHKFHVE